jgi:sec-independent protein translocase protein TatB
VFGISFTEILLIAAVALVVVGPQKLPRMLATVGNWIGRIRRMTTEMRRQTGLDELLRDEGLDGGLQELRGIMRGNFPSSQQGAPRRTRAAELYDDHVEFDRSREYPDEGADAYGAIPEDLLDDTAAEPAENETSPPRPVAAGPPAGGNPAATDKA